MKKFISLALAAAMSIACLSIIGGCNSKKDVIIRDASTVNIRVLKAGLGDEWIYELQEKFETAFADQGYKLNILTPSSDARAQTVITEMAQGYDKTGIDLYITGNVNPSEVGVNGDYGLLVEEIDESVHNEYPIGYDGQNEAITIGEKIDKEVLPFLKNNGKTYAFNWAQIAAGVVVNTANLAKYGVTELPRTTDEFLSICEKIYFGANGVGNSGETGVYPFTYVLGSNGYITCAFSTFFAQHGLTKYKEFSRMQKLNEDDTWSNVADPTIFYDDEDLLETLKLAYRFMDPNLAAPDSTTQQLDQAQSKIMKKTKSAIFMFNGQWFLNEVKFNYKNNLGDIDFMNVPVSSDIGVKLFGSGTSYNLSDSDSDKLLSYIISLVDQNKTIEEMVQLIQANKQITVSAEDVQTVATARGIYYSRGAEHVAYIAKGTPKKDIAALVLRMMASDDFAETFLKSTNVPTPYSRNLNFESQYKFVNSATAVSLNKYATMIGGIWGQEISPIRLSTGITTMIPRDPYFGKTIADQNISIYDGYGGLLANANKSVYENAARAMYQKAKADIVDAWNNRKDK